MEDLNKIFYLSNFTPVEGMLVLILCNIVQLTVSDETLIFYDF